MKAKERIRSLRLEIIEDIREIVKKQPKQKLEIYDMNGDLVIGGDDQESIVILSVEIKGKLNRLVVNFGVYDEDGFDLVDNLSAETLANILDACETAVKDLEREKQIDEEMNAELN